MCSAGRPDPQHAHSRRRSKDGIQFDDRPRADPLDPRRPGDQAVVEAYDPRVVDRGPLLRDLVQRLPRPDHRHGLDEGLQDLPPDGELVPALQPQRRAVPAQDRGQLRDAQPPQRQRPHAVRRHLPQPEPGPGPLGPPPARDGAAEDAPTGRARRSAPGRCPSRPPKAGCCSTTAC